MQRKAKYKPHVTKDELEQARREEERAKREEERARREKEQEIIKLEQARLEFEQLNLGPEFQAKLTKFRADALREILNLDNGIWKEMPDELILAPFIHENSVIPATLRKTLKDEYKIKDNQTLEFLGDAVIQLISTEAIMNIPGTNQKIGTELRSSFVKNRSLECYMRSKDVLGNDLCAEIYPPTINEKACADTFEAIVGVLYYWLYSIRETEYTYDLVRDWFYATWNFEELVEEAVKIKRENKPVSETMYDCNEIVRNSRPVSKTLSTKKHHRRLASEVKLSTRKDYQGQTVETLRKLAGAEDIDIEGLRKAELIDELLRTQK